MLQGTGSLNALRFTLSVVSSAENSGTGDDVPKNPIDNTESVDMDLSDEEASDQQRHSHDDGPTAGQAGREGMCDLP